jgi:RNA polymerase sigma factor (sigma-70 family)
MLESDHQNDHQLLTAYARENSEAAFAALVKRYVGLVYSAAFRHSGNVHGAEEIAQAVFIILARKANNFSERTILSGWLYQTTRLTAANYLRTEQRRQQREQEAYMQSLETDPATDRTWTQIAPLLDDALAELGARDRDAIVLRFFENKSAREIAGALRVEEAAAHKRVNRAVMKLRKFFLQRGVTLSAAAIAGAVSANSVSAAPVGLAKTISTVAVLKGAAATTSTLTLVKGALKIMAWTKVKMAAVTGTVILLAAATTVTTVYHHRHSPPSQTGRMRLPTGDVTPMIAYSFSHDIFILASDGSLWSWGENRLGWPALGYTNVEKSTSLRRIGDEADWKNVAVGGDHCLAIKSDGTLWGWGANYECQLGDGTKITRPTPVSSISGNDWKQAATSGGNSFAVKNNGTLWAWGNNYAGLLGIGGGSGTITNALQIGTSTNWEKLWAGDIQTVGLQSDGSLWFWGSLSGSSSDKDKNITAPTRVSSDTNWTDVCFGYFTMFALKSDGTLWSWGLKSDIYNGGPENGLDGSSVQLAPVQIGTENDWQSFSSAQGGFYLLLRKKDGSLWSLDASEHRSWKSGMKYKPISPRKIEFNKEIAAYAAGGDNIGIILTPDGEVWTWGNVIGELSPKDYSDAKGKQLFPKQRIIEQPWQILNIP